MFSVGDTVIYDTQGVCKIAEITTMNVCNVNRSFYVLKPVFEDRSTLYVPTDNDEIVASHMRLV
ncbi:MAG: CarD family transcriptional regulator, partial [Clostridia bacterium]|nr:CarD family transcriptional regulator [Clostridia bacterium]